LDGCIGRKSSWHILVGFAVLGPVFASHRPILVVGGGSALSSPK
jgi:hypothetical protein